MEFELAILRTESRDADHCAKSARGGGLNGLTWTYGSTAADSTSSALGTEKMNNSDVTISPVGPFKLESNAFPFRTTIVALTGWHQTVLQIRELFYTEDSTYNTHKDNVGSLLFVRTVRCEALCSFSFSELYFHYCYLTHYTCFTPSIRVNLTNTVTIVNTYSPTASDLLLLIASLLGLLWVWFPVSLSKRLGSRTESSPGCIRSPIHSWS